MGAAAWAPAEFLTFFRRLYSQERQLNDGSKMMFATRIGSRTRTKNNFQNKIALTPPITTAVVMQFSMTIAAWANCSTRVLLTNKLGADGPKSTAGKQLGFVLKVFRFLGFSVQRRPNTKLRLRKNISYMAYTILPVTSFSVNYSKTYKSRLKYEIKYVLYKLHKNLKTSKPKFGFLRFLV